MNLWLIVYVFGKVGGFAGPLPYGLDECNTRAKELRQDMQGHQTVLKNGLIVTDKDVIISCEYADIKPIFEDIPELQ